MAHRRGVVGTHGRNIYQLSAERGHAGVPPEWAEQPYLPTSLPPKRGRSRSGSPAAAADREQVKSRSPPTPGLPIPPTASPRRSGVPPPVPGPPGGAELPAEHGLRCRGRAPAGGCGGVAGHRACLHRPGNINSGREGGSEAAAAAARQAARRGRGHVTERSSGRRPTPCRGSSQPGPPAAGVRARRGEPDGAGRGCATTAARVPERGGGRGESHDGRGGRAGV